MPPIGTYSVDRRNRHDTSQRRKGTYYFFIVVIILLNNVYYCNEPINYLIIYYRNEHNARI